jgi:hypothetical protein
VSASRARLAVRALGLAALGLTAAVCLRGLDGAALARSLRGASLPLVAAAALAHLAQVLPRAALWRRLLGPGAPSLGALARVHVVGLAVSNLSSARLGDLARVALLRAGHAVPAPAALAVTVAEKAAGSVALAALSTPILALTPGAPTWARHGALAVGALGLALAGVVAGAPGLLRRVPALARIAHDVAPLRDGRSLGVAVLLAAVDWLVCGAAVLLAARAMGLGVGVAAAPLALLAVNAAVLLPSTPAQLGVYEVAVAAGLRAAGAEPDGALACAIVLHAAEALPATLLGVGLGAGRLARERVAPTRASA